MVFPYLGIFAGFALNVVYEAQVTKALKQNQYNCCGETQRGNETCFNGTPCESGCHVRVLGNNMLACVRCDDNITLCNYTSITEKTNHTTVAVIAQIGGPGVAVSVLLGTLLISLFLILFVASFFYIKRSNLLPALFYRRNKAFIFQPNETALMISSASSSVRKPRYVRRERPVSPSAATINV